MDKCKNDFNFKFRAYCWHNTSVWCWWPSNHAGVEEQPVLDYFETNYIGELRRGRRLEPSYPHTLWDMNLRVHENLPRTNNNLEGWHNRSSNSFAHRHTHVWKFIDGLKQDSSLNHLLMAQTITRDCSNTYIDYYWFLLYKFEIIV